MEIIRANVGTMFLNNILQFFILVAPFLGIAIVVGLISNLIQVGFLFTVDPLKPDIKKLNPIEGFKNIFSKKSLFTLFKNLLKLILVFYLTYINLSKSAVEIFSSGDIGSEKLFFFMIDLGRKLSFNIVIIMFGISIIDYVIQRRDHKKKLRMSKQDIKDEFKQMEGNPEIKAARRRRQKEISMGRMMEAVPEATVIVTNPTHIAIAIKYDEEGEDPPMLVAKGADYIAEKIREKAKVHDIPIIENKPLARTMYTEVEIGEFIPIELYQSVAEIIALVYKMREENKYKI